MSEDAVGGTDFFCRITTMRSWSLHAYWHSGGYHFFVRFDPVRGYLCCYGWTDFDDSEMLVSYGDRGR